VNTGGALLRSVALFNETLGCVVGNAPLRSMFRGVSV
jgi:hypothetical protein